MELVPQSSHSEKELPSDQIRTFIDLDEGKNIAQIDAERRAVQEAEQAIARAQYEKERDRVQKEAVRLREQQGDPIPATYIVPDDSDSLDGKYTSSHRERNHMDIVYEGIANANYPQDDPNLRS